MNTSTTQFVWKDRDAAAFDLLQLAYHAPNSIARKAIQLLEAIRSPKIISELVQIADDNQRDLWQRIYALRAIAATSGDWYLPHLAAIMKNILGSYQTLKLTYNGQLHLSLLHEIRSVVAHNPINQNWFFEVLHTTSNSDSIYQFLSGSLSSLQPRDFRDRLFEFLLKFLDKNPEQLTPTIINEIIFENNESVHLWLDQHIDEIVKMISSNTTDRAALSAAEGWAFLREKLMQINPDFRATYDTFILERKNFRIEAHHQNKHDLGDHKLSNAYKYVESLYIHAADGDITAYSKLLRLTKNWRKNIPLSAAATRFLGKLTDKPQTIETLCYLVKYANDEWDDRQDPRSPIRIEAGEILKNTASPDSWVEMVDAFFMKNGNVLSGFLLDWIAHMTDMLDGISTTYSGIQMGTEYNRRWFRVLSEISDEELEQLKI